MTSHVSRALIWGWAVALVALSVGDFADSLQHRVGSGEVIEDWVDVVEGTMQPAVVGVWVRR